ncbi:AraC-like DNA-binding protein/mannose-6-phosphate isomerase-like protein (cupin superfamily) [Clostridium algifaecis]|uniref:AraC-like DNA-binding protein/mannose-6-phosphate isomerase-like protein (Cupin superfamily) n=1 Tax=Clostridium algifaecis TaxID=1472040 RepID=A0ABS4KYZ9_9CLOT|nr:AraC family transcriptional regulator [Clostridium algifaecis]MBP2034089.1 AraC-like DNA-binding protein/mannose-6-phosphate isomerase-like protein (cupin superfamily) [Clostridium algifaecis]
MIQYFVKSNYESSFKNNNFPKLVHICKAKKVDNKFPRIMHMHKDMVEIVFIKEGSGIHTIGNNKYKTKKGDILIYNKDVLHDERSNLQFSTYVCGITNVKIEGLEENHLIPDNIKPIISSGKYFNVIENIFKTMYSEIVLNDKGAEETCNYLLLTIISIVLRLIDLSGNKLEQEKYQLGKRIKKYIDDNFLGNLNIKTLSENLGISPYYLIHTFKNETGYSPMHYIINRKIGEAQNLLINTNYSVAEIGTIVGYDNPNYFNMLFTKTIGMSPGKYRKYFVSKNFKQAK